MERVCFTFPSLELEESTGAVSGSPKTTQSQRVPVLMPNNSPTSPPPTHNQIRVDQTSPTSHPPPGGSLSGVAVAPSRNHSQEHTGPQLVLSCRCGGSLITKGRKTVKSKVETDTDLHWQSHKQSSVHFFPVCIIVHSYFGHRGTAGFSSLESDSIKLKDV